MRKTYGFYHYPDYVLCKLDDNVIMESIKSCDPKIARRPDQKVLNYG